MPHAFPPHAHARSERQGRGGSASLPAPCLPCHQCPQLPRPEEEFLGPPDSLPDTGPPAPGPGGWWLVRGIQCYVLGIVTPSLTTLRHCPRSDVSPLHVWRPSPEPLRTRLIQSSQPLPRPTPPRPQNPYPQASPDTRDTPTVPLGGEEGYDVYVYEAEPLEEGVAKHTLSVFVGDEAGMINRVAGVFARRGANIESLAVGLTQDKALFTIVATGTEATVANLCKQLAKLVNVRYVEDITASEHFQRELFIAKVAAPPGATRTELQQVAEVFRARVVDVAERTLTLSATGDPGKIAALQRALGRFGIVELVRTGRIALKRGENLFTGPQVYRKRPAISNADAGEPVNVEASMDGDVYTSSGSGSAAHEGV